MADDNIPQSIRNKPSERVIISTPFTELLVTEVKRLDRIMRTVDDRYGQGTLSGGRHSEVQSAAREVLSTLKGNISALEASAGLRRNRRRRDRNNQNSGSNTSRTRRSQSATAQPDTDTVISPAGADQAPEATPETSDATNGTAPDLAQADESSTTSVTNGDSSDVASEDGKIPY